MLRDGPKMNLLLSLLGCFFAIQAGAMVVCVGLMLVDEGPSGFFEGIAIWAFSQIVILPLALFAMPFGALFRMVLGFLFDQPKPVAIATGTLVGLLGALAIQINAGSYEFSNFAVVISIGSAAGFAGGLVWWLIERPHLERVTQ